MSQPICRASWKSTPFRFARWPRLSTRLSKSPHGHQFPPDAARWQERLAPLDTIVAESDGILAGFVSYTQEGYLDFLFTHPAFARRGIATSLYQRVEAALRAVSVPKVTSHVSLAARPFFERHGFQVDAEERVECRGVYLRRFAMHKQLRDERSA